jgi:hypothetical protein
MWEDAASAHEPFSSSSLIHGASGTIIQRAMPATGHSRSGTQH